MTITLEQIPGLILQGHVVWQIRALVIDGKSDVLTTLADWERYEKADLKKIFKAMRIVAQSQRVANEDIVRKSSNRDDGDVYEMRADKGNARMMFFYSNDEAIVVCTNPYDKRGGNQHAAFVRCGKLRTLYLQWKRSNSPPRPRT